MSKKRKMTYFFYEKIQKTRNTRIIEKKCEYLHPKNFNKKIYL